MFFSSVFISDMGIILLCTSDDPLVGAIAQQYLTDRATHDRIAQEWTKKYSVQAPTPVVQKPLTTTTTSVESVPVTHE